MCVVSDTIANLKQHMVNDSIRFPQGGELEQVMIDFGHLSGGGLPQCAGAVDGTFMHIKKPALHGDSFWCYKNYTAILVLACVDARGLFTYVNAGSPGSCGDAAVFNTSNLLKKVKRRKWLGTHAAVINGMEVLPYLVGDSAFALSSCLLKCYAEGQNAAHQLSFNFRLIRTRRVVEQAFGRLKGRFRVLVTSGISDPTFAADIAMVCCAIHNVCERWFCSFDNTWLIEPNLNNIYHPAPDVNNNNNADDQGIALRNHIAMHIQNTMPVYM